MIKAGLILEQCKIVSYMSLEGSLFLEDRCILKEDAPSAEMPMKVKHINHRFLQAADI
jgi:hypothetical protein